MKRTQKTNLLMTLLLMLFLSTNLFAQKEGKYIRVFTSKDNFETTVEKVKASAEKAGWVVLGVTNMDKNLARAGFDIRPVAIIEICNPKLAGAILGNDKTRLFSAVMPCRISVYVDENKNVHIGLLNITLAKQSYPKKDLSALRKAKMEMKNIILEAIK